MKPIPIDSLYQFLTNEVGFLDTVICSHHGRVFEGFNNLMFWNLRNQMTQDVAEGLEKYFDCDVPYPLEAKLIAEILFNFRFLSFIHYKCGQRKEGWVVKASQLFLKLMDRWITEQKSLEAISNLHFLFEQNTQP